MGLSRRDFLTSLAALSGPQAAYAAMEAFNLEARQRPAHDLVAWQRPPADIGKGKHVAIVGAGIAGLVCAYELTKSGFDVTVLEARDRVGGRNWTLRRDATVALNDGTLQRVSFDDKLYFNAGPARIPSEHSTILGYCRDFDVDLEVLVNASRSALCVSNELPPDNPITLRQLQNDARGHISELLVKSTRQGLLDADLTAEDRDKLIKFLSYYGDLSKDGRFTGSERSGYKIARGAGEQCGVINDPLDFKMLLDRHVWEPLVYEEYIDYQATMFQPVGGMDRIPAAFYARLNDKIRLNAEVLEINGSDAGASLIWRERGTDKQEILKADYAIVTIPLPVLSKVKINLPDDFTRAIHSATYMPACKLAWQSSRFWETDWRIYGGLSFVGAETRLIWYPSGGFNQQKGILLGCYNAGHHATEFADRTLAEQCDLSRAAVERIHPNCAAELSEPVAIAWHKMPFNEGAWTSWKDQASSPDYKLLTTPHQNIYLAGEHLSYLPGWQEGAALSALRAITLITGTLTDHKG